MVVPGTRFKLQLNSKFSNNYVSADGAKLAKAPGSDKKRKLGLKQCASVKKDVDFPPPPPKKKR